MAEILKPLGFRKFCKCKILFDSSPPPHFIQIPLLGKFFLFQPHEEPLETDTRAHCALSAFDGAFVGKRLAFALFIQTEYPESVVSSERFLIPYAFFGV